jgi:ATP synthase protein I
MTAEGKLATIGKVLIGQSLIVLVVSAGFLLLNGQSKALSSLLGGGAALIPNFYLALRILKMTGQPAEKIVRSFYAGESGKLILTAILFYLIFQIPSVELLPLLAGYIAALSIFWFALLMRD